MMRLAKSIVRGTVQTALAPLEAALTARHPAPRWPVVFIVGPPRSGTSLFYELLVTRYRFAFFTNLSHRFYRTPAAASLLGARLIRDRRPRFESDYGHIAGWSAPNEGGWIWRRWLADGDWTDERAAAGLDLAAMRATVGAVEAALGAPFVNKNVMHANRMRLLDRIYPGCLFIEVCRDPAETARSIVRAERKEKGPARHPDDWWSVRPSSVAPGSDLERAANQVTGVMADIDRDARHLGRDCLLRVDYARLCAATEPVLTEVAAFLRLNGVPVEDRAAVPTGFPSQHPQALADDEERRLRALIHG
jgi:hypothetical protein